jgi:Tol biopolymer transport system component
MMALRFRLVALVSLALLAAGCTWTARVSVDMTGGDANGASWQPALNATGRYVVFTSAASDLVSGDTNGLQDVFVRDARKNVTTRVSVDTTGGDANGESIGGAAISADGRYVVFASGATDLVPSVSPSGWAVYIRDMKTAETTMISVDRFGGNPNGSSFDPSISADGRYVAFASSASDLVAVDNNGGTSDVFVRDRSTGVTSLVSIDTTGHQPLQWSGDPSISSNGRYVAFDVGSEFLVLGDVLVRDLSAGVTTRASVDTAGGDPDGVSGDPSISGNGRYVAFWSVATDLVSADTNGAADVFVRDRTTGVTTRQSVDTTGSDSDGASRYPAMDSSGRYLAFESDASDLVSGDANGVRDVFVRDRFSHTTERASLDEDGGESNGISSRATLSADGRYAAFDSLAANLVPGDGNGVLDVFERAAITPTISSVSPSTIAQGSSATLTVLGSGFLPGTKASVTGNGGGVAVDSATVISRTELEIAVTVDPTATPGERDLVVWNPGTGPGATKTASATCTACLSVG